MGSSLEEDEVLDDDVNHENGDDVPGAWERGGRLSCEVLARPHHTPASERQMPHFADGVTEPSGSAYPAEPPPSTPPGACPTLGPAVQVDEGPVVQGEQGEEGEDGGEDALEALGVGMTEQGAEHHGEEDWLLRAKPGSGLPSPPTPPRPPSAGYRGR